MRLDNHTVTSAEKKPRSPLMATVVVVACVIVTVIGILVTIGCLVSIRLEFIDFGSSSDPDYPRTDYIALFAIGAVAGILVPAAACFFLLRSGQRIVAIVAALATLLVAIILLGAGLL